MAKKLTEQFIQEAKAIHGDKYDYSKVEYKNDKTKVCIICPEHGEFWQTPNNHLKGKDCAWCAKRPKIDTAIFINRLKQNFGDKYDYSKVNYINAKTKVCIILNGKEIWITPDSLLRTKNIKNCSERLKTINDTTFKNSNVTIVDRIRAVHGNIYNYKNEIIYKNNRPYLTIICNNHGEFQQRLDQHLSGKGCPKCSSSKGESFIEKRLKELNVDFEREKTFNDLLGINSGHLRFDFYLPKFNTCIEYQGKQHYCDDEYFGGKDALLIRQINDNIKKQWCIDNNINLVIIDKCPHGSFCNKDRIMINEAIEKII